jgi:hypothetical protein
MSYFVFGLIDTAGGDCAEGARRSAAAEGMDLKLGDDIGQPVLSEMLGAYSPTVSVPFLLTSTSSEDTSDSLISPFVASEAARAHAFAAIGRWLIATLRLPEVERVRVWMTEGYDSAFERLNVSAEHFADEVIRRVAAAGDVPSLIVSVPR